MDIGLLFEFISCAMTSVAWSIGLAYTGGNKWNAATEPNEVSAPSTMHVTIRLRYVTVSSYPPISASTSVSSVSPRGVISKTTSKTMYEMVVPTEMRLWKGG